MNFNLKEEHRMLQETLSKFFTEKYTAQVRESNYSSNQGFNTSIWSELCELGILGALMTEQQGGCGGAGEDIDIVFQALGKALATEPFLSSGILGLRLAAELNLNDLVNECLMGEKQVTLAHFELNSRYETDQIETTATQVDNGYLLKGYKTMVYGASYCQQLFVSAKIEGQDNFALFKVNTNQKNIQLNSYKLNNGSRASEVVLNDLEVKEDDLVLENAHELVEKIIALARLALISEALGAMEVAKDLTVEYMQDRKQFGRPLSAFQVIQHRCVDMVIEIKQLEASVIQAVSDTTQAITSNDWKRAFKSISSAKYLCGETGQLIAEESIQLHGGIGMTWDYPLAHYAKRITLINHQFGDTDYHLKKFIELGE